jgi:hypothetical protein
MNQMKEVFELFDLSVRRLSNGNKLRIVLERQQDIEIEKKLIEFRGENVKVKMTQEIEEDDIKPVYIEDIVEVFDIKCRRLRNGDKLSLILEQLYEKEKELQLVKLRYDNVAVFIEKIQDELFEDVENLND